MAKKANISKTFQELKEEITDELRENWDEAANREIEVISTSSLSLDISLGKGGIPRGRVTFIYGKPGSGKSHIACEVCKNAVVLNHLNALYVDAEGGTDLSLVSAFFNGYDYTTSGDILDYTITSGENYVEVVKVKTFEQCLGLIESAIVSGEFGLIVFDSISASSPEEELEKELTESTMMLHSKLLSKFFRRQIYEVIRKNVALVCIGQIRDKVGAYVPTVEPTGGNAIKHFTSIELSVKANTSTKEKDSGMIIEGDLALGYHAEVTTKKNKLAPPFRTCQVPIIFGKGVDKFRDFVAFAKQIGVVNTQGAWYYFGEERLGQGFDKAMVYLREHPETCERIRKKCVEITT